MSQTVSEHGTSVAPNGKSDATVLRLHADQIATEHGILLPHTDNRSPFGLLLPHDNQEKTKHGVLLPKTRDSELKRPTTAQVAVVASNRSEQERPGLTPAEITSLLFDPIQFVYLRLKNEFGRDPLRQEVLDHWREFGTKIKHVSELGYSSETLQHDTASDTFKVNSGESVEKTTYMPGSLELLGLNIFQIIIDEQVRADGDLVFCLLDPYRKLLSRYRTEIINEVEEPDRTDLLPQQSKLAGVCLEYLQDYPGSPFIKHHLYQIFELIELTSQQKEAILGLMDKQGDLRQPLALRLTAELAISDPECAWVLEQEQRRSELLVLMERDPQAVFDDYQNLAQLCQSLVWAGSWKYSRGSKVGIEIEYQRTDKSLSWASGFIEGTDLSNMELRRDGKELRFTPNYVRQLAMLSAYFGYQTGIDFSAFHLHLDLDQHPSSPAEFLPFDQSYTRTNVLGTWEVRDLIFPTLNRLRRPPIDVRAIANVITFLTTACSAGDDTSVSQMRSELLSIGQREDRISIRQLQLGHILRSTHSGEARLAFLMASENKFMFNAVSLFGILSSYTDINFFRFVDTVRDPFMINGLCYQFFLILVGEVAKPNYIELDDCWTFLERNANDEIAKLLASALDGSGYLRANFDRAWKIIEQKGGDKTAGTLARVMKLSRFDEERRSRFLDFIEQRGGDEAVVPLIRVVGSSILSRDHIDRVWKIIERKSEESVLSELVYSMRLGYLFGDNLDRAWPIINQKGGENTAIALSHGIKHADLSEVNIKPALEFINRHGGEKAAYELAVAVRYGKLTNDDLLLALDIIIEKGDESALRSLIPALENNELGGKARVLLWKFITEKGGEGAAEELVYLIVRDKLNESDLSQAWNFINQKGGVSAADALVRFGALSHLSGSNLAWTWRVIQSRGGEAVAEDLLAAIESGMLRGRDLVLARNFIDWRNGNTVVLESVDTDEPEVLDSEREEPVIRQPRTSLLSRIKSIFQGR